MVIANIVADVLGSVIINIVNVPRVSLFGDSQVHGLCYVIKGKPGYGLYDDESGLPSVMHVNMLMWACSPDMKTITKNANKYLEIIKKN